MTILDQIMQERMADVDEARERIPEHVLQRQASTRTHHSLKQRLAARGDQTCIIAEMKKASPSAGLLRSEYDPASIANLYEQNGACGISVLTEPRHFQGSVEHLRQVRAVTELPLLRKDFMVDPYQVIEAAAWGADVILLIAAALDDHRMHLLYQTALSLGMDVLAEVHTEDELQRVLPMEHAILGVNSRNLKTLTTDLATAHSLAVQLPAGRVAIAESGISRREEIDALEQAGYAGFLIGESLLRCEDAGSALAILLRAT